MAGDNLEKVQTNASTISEYGFPNGHLTHLSTSEADSLTTIKKILEDRGLLKPSHDDALLLRFLRARRWVPEEAFKQFKDTEEWRKANDIEVLYKTIEVDAYEQSRRMYPQWTGRRDRRGIPLYVFVISTLEAKAMSQYEKTGATSTFSRAKPDGKTPPGLLRLFALYENLTNHIFPFCSQLKDREWPGTPVTMSTNIVDVTGVGLKQFWNLKGHMQAASQLATAHYPETLDRIFVIGAPAFFSTVWGWIKRWFDPTTVSKILILSPSEVLPTLSKYVDPKNIPKQYGGELEYEFGQLPVADPVWEGVIEWDNGHMCFPTGPHVWQDAGDRVECIGIGCAGGKERRERICSMPRNYRWDGPPLAAEEAAEEAAAEAPPAGNNSGSEPDQKEGADKEEEPVVAAAETWEPPKKVDHQQDLVDKVDKVVISEPSQQNGKPVEVNEKATKPFEGAIPTTVV